MAHPASYRKTASTPQRPPRRQPYKLLLGLLCVGWVLWQPPAVRAQEEPPIEYQVKASYLYNFMQFVRWPNGFFDGRDGYLRVCVVGEDRFGLALDALANEVVWNQRIAVHRLRQQDDLANCQVVFVSDSERRTLNNLLRRLHMPGVLTVGESDDFARLGGVINLIRAGDKIRFEVNRSAAQQAGLDVSAQLLNLAVRIYDDQVP